MRVCVCMCVCTVRAQGASRTPRQSCSHPRRGTHVQGQLGSPTTPSPRGEGPRGQAAQPWSSDWTPGSDLSKGRNKTKQSKAEQEAAPGPGWRQRGVTHKPRMDDTPCHHRRRQPTVTLSPTRSPSCMGSRSHWKSSPSHTDRSRGTCWSPSCPEAAQVKVPLILTQKPTVGTRDSPRASGDTAARDRKANGLSNPDDRPRLLPPGPARPLHLPNLCLQLSSLEIPAACSLPLSPGPWLKVPFAAGALVGGGPHLQQGPRASRAGPAGWCARGTCLREDWFLSPIWAEPARCSPSPAAWASSANGTRCQLCGRHVGGGLGAGPWRLPGTTPQATRPCRGKHACRAPRTHSTSLQPPCSTPTRRILSLKTGLPGRPVWLSGAAWA